MISGPTKILVADDDDEDLDLIEEYILLVEPAVQLYKFMDGLSAYEYLLSRPDDDLPSLIILDYNMPGLNGAQLLGALNSSSRYGPIPKVVLSSASTAKFIEESLNNGANDYIVKPGTIDEIYEMAKKLVALARKEINPQEGK